MKLHSKKEQGSLSQDSPLPGVSESTYVHQLALRMLCTLCHDCNLENKHIILCWLTQYKIPLLEQTLLTKRKLLNGVYTPLRTVIWAHLITSTSHEYKADVRPGIIILNFTTSSNLLIWILMAHLRSFKLKHLRQPTFILQAWLALSTRWFQQAKMLLHSHIKNAKG